MSFYIDIGYTTDNAYKLQKDFVVLSPEGGVAIDAKAPIDILHPVFVINYNPVYINANYIYAAFLNRYYFVSAPILMTGDRMSIPCSVDYLSSFDLSNCPITATRNGGIGHPTLIPDNKLPVLPSQIEQQYITVYNDAIDQNANFEGSLSYVLSVISGGVAPPPPSP